MSGARALKPGDVVGIAASSSPFDRNLFLKGIRALERMGFTPFYRHDIFDQNRYFAGTDQRRADEFVELLANKDVAAIMFARGGYGSQRVIPLLDAQALAAHGKPVVGFSDMTALLAFLRQRAMLPTLYGPVVTQLGKEPSAATLTALQRALSTAGPLGPIPAAAAATMRPGTARGPLVGGCLSLINSSIGTPYALNAEGAILFLEDTGEKVYVIDRMLTQLKNAGLIARARGIIFGSMLPPEGDQADIDAMLRDVLADFEGPVVTRFPAGHVGDFVTLPLGVEAELTAPDLALPPTLTFLQGLLS
jgi:muramoyltetrapeptide carboxypeptidase